jgi:hypothetical protein
MEDTNYERLLELWEMRRMKIAAKNGNGCDCSLCFFFPDIRKNHEDYKWFVPS